MNGTPAMWCVDVEARPGDPQLPIWLDNAILGTGHGMWVCSD